MLSPLTFRGRLPGVVCDPALPPTPAPLRLDVAGFVGLAERGPLGRPVALEDANQFKAAFGGDLMLARQGGVPTYAHLGSAVRAFFDNGGRRCHVVRVAGPRAAANCFRLTGLAAWDPFEGRDGLRAVHVPAASVGRWSAQVQAGVQLGLTPLRVAAAADVGGSPYRAARPDAPTPDWPAGQPASLALDLPSLSALLPGDIIRVRLGDADGTVVLFPVARVRPRGRVAPGLGSVPVTAEALPGALLALAALPDPPPLPLSAQRLAPDGWEPLSADIGLLEPLGQGAWSLELVSASAPRPGDLLRLHCLGAGSPGAEATEVLFPVVSAEPLPAGGSPFGGAGARIRGEDLACFAALPGDSVPRAADLLRFDLLARDDGEAAEIWPALRFNPAAAVGAPEPPAPSGPLRRSPAGRAWLDALAPPGGPLDPTDPAAASHSALLGTPAVGGPLFLPLGMPAWPRADEFAGPTPRDDGADAWADDGLEQFDPPTLFLDPRLAAFGARDLLNEAENLGALQGADGSAARCPCQPAPTAAGWPRGLHALLPVDEIGLIALPDVVQPGWPGAEAEPLPEPPPPPPPPPPDWSGFRDCAVAGLPVAPPGLPLVAPCAPPSPLPPAAPAAPTEAQRVAALPPQIRPNAYDPAGLLAVQRALLTLCQARADLVAVLDLPPHFGTREALDWRQQLAGTPAFADGDPLSYAAVYHPWVQAREEVTPDLAPLRALPPSGALCGTIAARELARGCWIAPANLALRGVVALAPALPAADLPALFDARVNLLRQQPGRFAVLSAHTLSADSQLVQLSVRRLLIFLRKLALLRGQRYVFESNTPRFRRGVQQAFERTLRQLAARGALVAFRVSADDSLNPQADQDNGRFVIAIQVAPTLPVEFITVVLIRSGEDVLSVVER